MCLGGDKGVGPWDGDMGPWGGEVGTWEGGVGIDFAVPKELGEEEERELNTPAPKLLSSAVI